MRPCVEAGLLEHRLDDLLDHAFADRAVGQLPVAVPLGVLGGDHDRPHRHRPVALVLHRHLRLAVRAGASRSGRARRVPFRTAASRSAIRCASMIGSGIRSRVSFGGVAEHHALVARALRLLGVRVHAHRDVGRLPVDRGEHRAGAAVHAEGGVGVADALHRLAHEVGNVDVGLGGDLAGDDRHARGDQGLAGHPARRIPRQDGVEHRVGDLVGHLVGMAFGDRFGGEDVTLGCGHRLRVRGWR